MVFCIQVDLIRKAMLNVHVRSISNTKTATDNQVGIVLPEVVLHKQRSHLCQRRKYSLSHDEGRISTGKNFLGKFRIIVGDDIAVDLSKFYDESGVYRNWFLKTFKHLLN